MTATDIRTTLAAVAKTTDVPDVDQLAFQGRVRAVRRRRATSRAITVAAAVGLAASVAFVGVRVVGDDSATELSPSQGGAVAVEALPEVNWFVLDHTLVALDSTGQVHRLDQPAEAVVGYTSERVYATDGESRLVAYDVRPADTEGSGRIVIEQGAVPVDGPVQSAALSGDGRYLAWVDLEAGVHSYDLKAGRENLTLAPTGDSVQVVDVGAPGALLVRGDQLMFASRQTEKPITRAGNVHGATLGFDAVAVPGDDGRTRIFLIATDPPEQVETHDGVGYLAPDGNHVAVIRGTYDEPGSSVSLWSKGEPYLRLTGIEGVPEHVRWADEQSLLVYTRSERGSVVYGCGVYDLRCAPLPLDGDVQPYE